MKLEITRGEWRVTNEKNENCFIHPFLGAAVARIYTSNEHSDEAQANAILIADAGTTANKCQLLPSELLVQRDELLEALVRITEANKALNTYMGNENGVCVSDEVILQSESAIKKAKAL